jgi:hypothetical protein
MRLVLPLTSCLKMKSSTTARLHLFNGVSVDCRSCERIFKPFQDCKSIMHAEELVRTCLHCRIILKGNSMKPNGCQSIFPLAVRTVWLCVVLIVLFTQWISGEETNTEPLHNLIQHLRLQNNRIIYIRDISRIVNILFARIIYSLFDMFPAAVEVDGRPGCCSSSFGSAPPQKLSDNLCPVFRPIQHFRTH